MIGHETPQRFQLDPSRKGNFESLKPSDLDFPSAVVLTRQISVTMNPRHRTSGSHPIVQYLKLELDRHRAAGITTSINLLFSGNPSCAVEFNLQSS